MSKSVICDFPPGERIRDRENLGSAQTDVPGKYKARAAAATGICVRAGGTDKILLIPQDAR